MKEFQVESKFFLQKCRPKVTLRHGGGVTENVRDSKRPQISDRPKMATFQMLTFKSKITETRKKLPLKIARSRRFQHEN